MRITATLFATAFWLMATTPTLAAECEAPCFSFSFTSKLKSDWVFSANPSSKTGIDTGPSAELELRYAPTDQLSFVGVITGESVNDRRPGENRTFKDLGLYAGALYAEYAAEPVTFRLGKFDPDFSLGSATLDGQYAAGLSDTYDTEERWGVQAVYAFPGEALSQSLTASLFTTDRSVLSQSLGTDRGRLSLDDGGAGNVKGIGSAAAFYDICSGAETGSCFADGDFGARIGLRYQKAGQPTQEQIDEEIVPQAELGYLGAVTRRVAISEDTDLRLLGELAYFRNFEGGEDNALIATASAALNMGPVTYSATYSQQRNHSGGNPATTDQLLSIGARYELGSSALLPGQSWTIDAGYSYLKRGDGTDDHRIGFSLAVALDRNLK